MKSNPFKKARRGSGEMSLQITSMADIFIIILVFLLKSYATSSVNITPSAGMKLPTASAEDAAVEALKLEISENAVQIENKPVVELNGFKFSTDEIQSNQTSRSVSQALEVERKRQNLIAEANPSVKVDSKILIIADQRTPYQTIKSVLASAALNGFTDYKFVTVKRE